MKHMEDIYQAYILIIQKQISISKDILGKTKKNLKPMSRSGCELQKQKEQHDIEHDEA